MDKQTEISLETMTFQLNHVWIKASKLGKKGVCRRKLFCYYPLLYFLFNSAIHKAPVQPVTVPNSLWRIFCMAASFDILEIILVKPVEWPNYNPRSKSVES